jgi:hypothetical protein
VPVVDPVSDVLEATASVEVDEEIAAEGGPWMTITMLVVVSTGRSLPGAARPSSGRRCWRPIAGGAPSLAVMRLRLWKVPIFAHAEDLNQT